MARLVALVLGVMLCLSVTIGSVAHAAEGPVPVESACATISDHGGDDAASQDADKAISHSHACHGHHIGVPPLGIATPINPELARVMTAVSERALPSVRPRAPIKPPRA